MPKPAQPALLRAKGTDSNPTPVTMLMTLSTAWVKVAFPAVCVFRMKVNSCRQCMVSIGYICAEQSREMLKLNPHVRLHRQ